MVIAGGYKNIVWGSVRGTAGDGIVIEDGEENELWDVEVRHAGGSGVVVRRGQRHRVRADVDSCAQHGIWLDSTLRTSVWPRVWGCGGDGVRITGGGANWLDDGQIVDNRGAGILLHAGTVDNYVAANELRANEVGLHLQDAGTAQNQVHAERIVGSRTDGLVLSGGPTWNTVRAQIDSSGQDGAVLRDPGTQHNRVSGPVSASRRHGVHLHAGASSNRILCSDILDNGGSGLLIADAGTDGNICSDVTLRVLRNGLAGIRLLGDGASGPASNAVAATLEDNSVYGVWVSGVAPPAGLGNSLSIEAISGSDTGIELDGGTQRVTIRPAGTSFAIRGATNGIVLAGDSTAYNTVDGGYEPRVEWNGVHIAAPSEAGVRITANARNNALLGVAVDEGLGTGWLVDGGARDNHIMGSKVAGLEGDACVLDGAEGNVITELRAERCRNGLVLRNGARNNVVDGALTSLTAHRLHGVVISGTQTQSNRIREGVVQENGGLGLWITDGAANTLLGDQHADGTPSRRRLELFSNAGGGVLLDGGARQVEISGTTVMAFAGPFHPGIVVRDGAKGVRIGVADKPRFGGNEGTVQIAGCDPAVLIHGADVADVTVVHSVLGSFPPTQLGVVVRDGARNVVIGGDGWDANRIAGFEQAAILAADPGTEVAILGNEVVNNLAGIVLTDGIHGVRVSGNKIWLNNGSGILVEAGAHHNEIRNNTLGMNQGGAVVIRAADHNTLLGNDIQGNGSGITVAAGGQYNTLRGNAITSNRGKGIELRDGANGGLPAPVIDEFSVDQQRVQGYVESSVPVGSVVDVYADEGDEGKIYLGSYRLTSRRFYLEQPVPPGMRLHALVTDPEGNTSEFGPWTPALAAATRPPLIVYAAETEGRGAVWALVPSRDEPTRLSDAAVSAYSPRLSPDGQYVTFTGGPEGGRDLYAVPLGGGAATRLTVDPGDDYDPAWSPDGTELVFVSNRSGTPDLYTMAVDPVRPGGEIAYDDGEAELGESLATLSVSVQFEVESGYLHAIRMLLQEPLAPFAWKVFNWEDEAELASGVAQPSAPGWFEAPVGVEISGQFGVLLAAVDGAGPTLGADLSNSTWHSFTYYAWGRSPSSFNYMIRAQLEPLVRRLTQDAAAQREPVWSPDGAEIAFADDAAGTFDLYILNLASGAVHRLTEDIGDECRPQWSAGGDIAFTQYRGDAAGVYAIQADGGNLRQLVDHAGREIQPVWAMDGQLVFVADWEGGWELYRLPPTGQIRRLTALLGAAAAPHALE